MMKLVRAENGVLLRVESTVTDSTATYSLNGRFVMATPPSWSFTQILSEPDLRDEWEKHLSFALDGSADSDSVHRLLVILLAS